MSKKQTRHFLYMIIALVVCVTGYFVIDSYCHKQKEQEEEESKNIAEENKTVVFEMKSVDDVTAVSYMADGEKIRLFKDSDGVWKCDAGSEFKINKSIVTSTMLNKFVCVISDQIIESPENTAQYGFDNPQNKIAIKKSDGNSYVFTIGAQNKFDTDKYYMMIAGDDNVYIVDSDIPSAFTNSPEDLKEEETTVTDTTEQKK